MWEFLLGTPGERGPRGATLWQKITFSSGVRGRT
jgi:hypothetical protein